jgi:hypothetical protein
MLNYPQYYIVKIYINHPFLLSHLTLFIHSLILVIASAQFHEKILKVIISDIDSFLSMIIKKPSWLPQWPFSPDTLILSS